MFHDGHENESLIHPTQFRSQKQHLVNAIMNFQLP